MIADFNHLGISTFLKTPSGTILPNFVLFY